MDQIGNAVLQCFASVLLPVMLAIFVLSILMGIRNPEHLLEEVLGLMQAIVSVFVKAIFSIIKALIKMIGDAIDKPKRAVSSQYPGKDGGSKRKAPGPVPRT